jgi:hypothetical protein
VSEEKPLARLEPEQATAFFNDPDWIKAAGILGLYALIPVLGPIVVAGWGRERFQESLTQPGKLSPISFDRDLEAGQAVALGILGWPAALLALNAVRGLLTFLSVTALQISEQHLNPELVGTLYDLIGGVSELTSTVVTLLWLPWVLLLPELMRRVYQGDPFPWQNPGPSYSAIRNSSDAYFKVLIGTTIVLAAAWVVSGVFGWIGLLIAPMVWAVLSNFAAQWQGMVRERGAEGTI